jgi:hypothetical protein
MRFVYIGVESEPEKRFNLYGNPIRYCRFQSPLFYRLAQGVFQTCAIAALRPHFPNNSFSVRRGVNSASPVAGPPPSVANQPLASQRVSEKCPVDPQTHDSFGWHVAAPDHKRLIVWLSDLCYSF